MENSIEKRLDNLEDKINGLDKSVAVYSVISERNLQIQEKLSNSIDKLSDTTAGLQNTLIAMQGEIKKNSDEQERNSQSINRIELATNSKIEGLEIQVQTKIESLKSQLSLVDDKSKFDFVKYLRENFVAIFFVGYVVFEKVMQYLSTK